jgi:dethiobiotin synthetase
LGNRADRYFITGTDTGVGKTVVSLMMMQLFYKKGYSPFYLKPLQTGCRDPYDEDSDARFVYQNVGALSGKDPADSVIYCFENPKAPYFAARDEGKEKDMDVRVIQDIVNRKTQFFNPVIIEGAGGLLVPVGENTLMIDLIELTASKPIIAARAGLGTINHTLLTLEALNRRGIEPLGIVFIDSGETPTPRDLIGENIEAIETASGVKVAGVIGRIEDFSCPKNACYQPIERMGIL